MTSTPASTGHTAGRTAGRIELGAILVLAGTSHLTFARDDFRAQVPEFVPLPEDTTVLLSGVAEISLGSALLFAPAGLRGKVGLLAAAFFTAIFPGNIAQAVHHKDAFGLDTDAKRIGRLFGQPLLIAWALWSTAALVRRAK
ncbi:putative membrane protein [Cryobacterium sp. MP_3.1]|uniref:DoxX family protein n=1 Tax=Cryobacterium sp. MP_3.1 TaxID=3071711 RepID=UPI002DFF340E|nr:putative membrane protein [Cryobacterium sp. MP_3.1]